jgi:hypothetical protein
VVVALKVHLFFSTLDQNYRWVFCPSIRSPQGSESLNSSIHFPPMFFFFFRQNLLVLLKINTFFCHDLVSLKCTSDFNYEGDGRVLIN